VARDWRAFERKLAGGKLIEQAAEEAGIPVAEAVDWLAANRKQLQDDEALRILAAEALSHGITTLIELTKIRDGRIGTETEREGKMAITTKFDHPDGSAARTLVQAGLKLRQMIRPRAEKDAAGKDLFDSSTGDSNWQFTSKR
jgi:hypothetical protein